MELAELVAMFRRFGWLLVATTVVGAVIGVTRVAMAQPIHRSSVQFFVSSAPGASRTPLQSDIYTQQRLNTYLALFGSDLLVDRITTRLGGALSAEQVRAALSASVDTATVLLTVRATTDDPQVAAALTAAVVQDFGAVVAELETVGSDAQVDTSLNVMNGPAPEGPAPRDSFPLNALLGALLGLAAGLGYATIRHRPGAWPRTARDVEAATGLAFLATVPDARPRGSGRSSLDARSDDRAGAVTVLRTAMTARIRRHRSAVLVTSTTGASEDPDLVVELCRSFAALPLKVVLVDADLRTAAVSTVTGTAGRPGLAQVLAGTAAVPEVVVTLPGSAVAVLPAGRSPSDAVDPVADRGGPAVIERLRRDFDIVMLAVPALDALGEARAWAGWADEVVLLVRPGSDTLADVRRAESALRAVGVRRLLAVGLRGPADDADGVVGTGASGGAGAR